MFHPLIDNCRALKDSELELKIIDLGKKYYIAARMGQGSAASQIAVALEMYKDEQRRRQYEMSKSLLDNQDKSLDDLINVN